MLRMNQKLVCFSFIHVGTGSRSQRMLATSAPPFDGAPSNSSSMLHCERCVSSFLFIFSSAPSHFPLFPGGEARACRLNGQVGQAWLIRSLTIWSRSKDTNQLVHCKVDEQRFCLLLIVLSSTACSADAHTYSAHNSALQPSPRGCFSDSHVCVALVELWPASGFENSVHQPQSNFLALTCLIGHGWARRSSSVWGAVRTMGPSSGPRHRALIGGWRIVAPSSMIANPPTHMLHAMA
jgi:hypothetical protein